MNATASFSPTEKISQLRALNANPAMDALRSSRCFSGLSTAVLSHLAAGACIRAFGPGQEVVLEGRWLGAAVLVVRGCVSMVRRTERELTLESFQSGDVLADALVHPENHLPNDSLIATETTILLLLLREDFWAVARMVPDVALALAREFERRLSSVKSLAWGLATTDVESRLYRLIFTLARDQGEVGSEGTVIKSFPTQQDLGRRIGACRETVSRIVADLARKNLLALTGRRLTLSPGFFALARAAEVG